MTDKRYKRLGQYIELVQERNKGAENTNLMGVSIAKKFIPSIANIIGTDLSTYRVVHPGNFAFCPVTSRNGEKITIARYRGNEDCIISQAYLPFRVTDENKLDPDYLMMWVLRPEFDRYARFHSHGSVRELFSWDEMCNVYLPIPDISEQRRIVAEYQAIEQRIENNNRLIKTLEATAQAIYHHTFVENIDPENLPEGWRKYTVGEFFPVVTGKKDANIATENGKYPFFTCSQEALRTDMYSFEGDAILLAGNGDFNVKYYKGKFEAYQRTYVLIPQDKSMLGLLFNVVKYEISRTAKEAKGSVIQFLTKGMVENIKFYAPKELDKDMLIHRFNDVCDLITNTQEENVVLDKIKQTLLSKLS